MAEIGYQKGRNDDLRRGPPWKCYRRQLHDNPLDYEREKGMMGQLADEIRRRLA